MKSKIHPQYYPDAKIVCNCGHTFVAGSTKPAINVEVCNKCHPLYTGEKRFMDIEGRVDVFKKKMEAAKTYREKVADRKNKKGGKEVKKTKSLRELLSETS